MLTIKRCVRVFFIIPFLLGCWFSVAYAETRQWQERIHLNNHPCIVTFRADYLTDEKQKTLLPWPYARFSATSTCFPSAWQATAAMRVLLKTNDEVMAIDEAWQCQRLRRSAGGGSWQACALSDIPLAGLYRNIWGPVRVASAELKGMHQEELDLLYLLRRGGRYQRFTHSYSEQLWLHRLCGDPIDVVHHFERWQACIATLDTKWPIIFVAETSRRFDYPQFVEATIINPP